MRETSAPWAWSKLMAGASLLSPVVLIKNQLMPSA
ncbi:hypothetical protein EV646_101430 [Kribbella antiqua]|uniref:Uncharacterized protein n=1 Tax=Kribbella antiqua TaxID=2512217 RepID=A0A4V2S5B2_9ACTN|nr:hypothetical protein EV646_101430 [Kribbella antiqua]